MSRTLKHIVLGLVASWWLAPCAPADGGASSLYWSITGDSGHAGYLLGTIHSEDPRVLEFTDALLSELTACDVFAMELVPDLPNLSALQQVMRLPEGERLSGLLGEPRFERVVRSLGDYGLSAQQADAMKPWAVMLLLSVPRPQTGLFMDFALSLRASASGVQVVGLESVDEQLAFLETLDLERQVELLDHALDAVDDVDAMHDRMVDAYLRGDLDALLVETREEMRDVSPATRDHFFEQGIDARNRNMLENAQGLLREGTVFIAVGALHLAGEQGLVRLLRDAGYTLKPLPMPFPAALDQAAGRTTEATPRAAAMTSSARPQAGSTHTTARPGTAKPRLAASQSAPR